MSEKSPAGAGPGGGQEWRWPRRAGAGWLRQPGRRLQVGVPSTHLLNDELLALAGHYEVVTVPHVAPPLSIVVRPPRLQHRPALAALGPLWHRLRQGGTLLAFCIGWHTSGGAANKPLCNMQSMQSMQRPHRTRKSACIASHDASEASTYEQERVGAA